MIYPVQADDAATSMASAEMDARFTAAMYAAEEAVYKGNRESAIEHFHEALTYRPDHPENLAIEFTIGIELSQRKPPRPSEAMIVFEHILATYTHMDYYSERPVNSSGSMQFMMPKAGVLVANLMLGAKQNPQKAQEYLLRAMEQMNETYQKRIKDWSDVQPVDDRNPFSDIVDDMKAAKRQSVEHIYEQQRAAAAKGNVFSSLEMVTVEEAVRQYGYSHGRHRPEVAIVVMREIIDRFPGTPMAKVAQGHIDKALAMLDQERLDDLAEKITYIPPPEPNTATQPTTPSPTPPPGRDSKPKSQDPSLATTLTASLRAHPYAWLTVLAAIAVAAGVVLYSRKRRR